MNSSNFIKTTKKCFMFLYHHIGEIIFSVLFLTLLGYILIPNISLVNGNAKASECSQNMAMISNSLNTELNDENIAFDWKDVLYQTRSQRILDEVKNYSSNEHLKTLDTSEYYFKNNGKTITLICRYHEDNEPVDIEIPKKHQQEINKASGSGASKTDLASSITVTGIRTYMKDEQLDAKNPDKMKFTSKDDLKSIFSDIKVNLQYIGGKTITLDKNSYKLTTEGFDMSKAGTKKITVVYTTNNDWENTLHGSFTFEVMENSQSPEFIVDFGKKGSFRLASWDWSDYVRDAMRGDGEEMYFDASIVHFNGKYLYYPDGFVISKLRDNTNPVTSAADCDNKSYSAYFIKFDKNTIIENEETQKQKIRDGVLRMDENNNVYIWQVEPSKEVGAGWLRVYCDMEKIK